MTDTMTLAKPDADDAIIQATDQNALDDFGELFWLNELQRLRGLEGLGPRGLAEFSSTFIAGATSLEVLAARDNGCSREKATILSMPLAGPLCGTTLLEAVWSGYMLSLKATMDGGKNRRAHVGRDADAVELATAIADRLGAFATPSDEVYGSDGTYLEAIRLSFDPETGILSAEPSIGS